MEEKKMYFCPHCNEGIECEEELDYACSVHHKNASSESEEQKVKFKVGHYSDSIANRPECNECKKIPNLKKPTRLHKPFDSVLCPVCGKTIPLLIFNPDYEIYRICFAGTKNSGKTCYKRSLRTIIECGMSDFGPNHIKYDTGSSEIKSFNSVSEQDLPAATTSSITDENDYYLDPNYLDFKTPDGRSIFLIIYDIAGEDYDNLRTKKNQEKINIWESCITKADGIFFLLDPKQSFRNHLGASVSGKVGDEQVETRRVIDLVLTDVKELLSNKDIIKIPKLAYIYSKFDDPEIQAKFKEINTKYIKQNNNMKEGLLLWSDEEAKKVIDYQYSDYYQCKKNLPDPCKLIYALAMENDQRFRFTAQDKYGDFPGRCFVISALGINSEVDEENGKLIKLGTPFRVFDPIFWVMGVGERAE